MQLLGDRLLSFKAVEAMRSIGGERWPEGAFSIAGCVRRIKRPDRSAICALPKFSWNHKIDGRLILCRMQSILAPARFGRLPSRPRCSLQAGLYFIWAIRGQALADCNVD